MVWPIIALPHSQKKPNLKRLIFGARAAKSFACPAPVRLRWLRRSHHRQHTGSFAICVVGGHRLLLKDDVFTADRADHGAESFAIGFKKTIEAHHAPAAHRYPNFLGTVRTHRPASPSRWAKYIPETRPSANCRFTRKLPARSPPGAGVTAAGG